MGLDWKHRTPAALKQARYAFELLLERRLWLFVAADSLVLLQGLFSALLGTGKVPELYRSMVAIPLLLLGVPALASAVALERRAGSLDLALAVPSTELYFLRRVTPISIFLIVQAWLLTFVAFLVVHQGGFLDFLLSRKGVTAVIPLLLHSTEVGLLVAAVTLFWASRISTAGGTMVASFATLGALYKWIFASPIIATGPKSDWVLGVLPPAVIELTWNLTVLALATVLFYLYARERLRRPEVMLA